MSVITRPLLNTVHYLRKAAHERPVVFFSIIVGAIGPALVLTVPPMRMQMGWKPAERIPVSYPLPAGPREAVSGYDDE
ncbi:Uncharacterized protein MSYG_0789 [Malassezia sympodialis ATCC 42132]|uniref:Uncharacterized protein n=1 Tax=Malassezia sympodialis (strain ATCC 42132) TaxID=1230383 RepID=A0A1M8A226_MALS4|nr:Uncharacterized protein MSYG_0789 [Malassezia sympodialis ATCC 42132]